MAGFQRNDNVGGVFFLDFLENGPEPFQFMIVNMGPTTAQISCRLTRNHVQGLVLPCQGAVKAAPSGHSQLLVQVHGNVVDSEGSRGIRLRAVTVQAEGETSATPYLNVEVFDTLSPPTPLTSAEPLTGLLFRLDQEFCDGLKAYLASIPTT